MFSQKTYKHQRHYTVFFIVQKCNGIDSKLTSLHASDPISLTDIIVLTETNLNSSISSSEFGFDGYVVFRKDRSALTSNKLDGGGVLIAVRKTHHLSQVSHPDLPVEALCVLVKLNAISKFLISGVYIPPQADTRTYFLFADSFIDFISVCHKYDQVLLEISTCQASTEFTLTSPSLLPQLTLFSTYLLIWVSRR